MPSGARLRMPIKTSLVWLPALCICYGAEQIPPAARVANETVEINPLTALEADDLKKRFPVGRAVSGLI